MDCAPVVVDGDEALRQWRGSPHRTFNVVTVYWDNGGLNVVCATVIYYIMLLTPPGHGIAHNPTHTHSHLKLDHMTSLHVTTYVTT